MPQGPLKSSRVAIVGASSLRGKELKRVLEERNYPAGEIILLDESVMVGTLTEAAGEPTFIRALEEDSFERARFAFFAGSPADAERNWQVAQRAGATVIDLTGAIAVSGHATSWIPSLSSVLLPVGPSQAGGSARAAAYYSPPSPVVIACTLAAGLGKLSPQRIMILFFPPVSERDQAGVEELENQTTNLLTFREISKVVFDEQLAFNLLKGYGAESKPRLEDVRKGVAREVAQYLAGRAPTPAIQLVQAPVFYGYAFAAYAEFASAVPIEILQAAFAGLGVKFSAAGDPTPTNISVAGESEIHLARIEPDPNVSTGAWLWGVADNLRLAATNAVRIAEELLAESRVQ
ncbi:MAG TPA: Asd/ArgC dimerization domain-containing protein [Candidatus Limnocylindria bacterium]|nr:Asd/ArgC dimerization domain-containing protein [Candidatus Limnocylindria bacterium]